jgi:hypothetical protein
MIVLTAICRHNPTAASAKPINSKNQPTPNDADMWGVGGLLGAFWYPGDRGLPGTPGGCLSRRRLALTRCRTVGRIPARASSQMSPRRGRQLHAVRDEEADLCGTRGLQDHSDNRRAEKAHDIQEVCPPRSVSELPAGDIIDERRDAMTV